MRQVVPDYFVMRDNPLPDKLSGSLVGELPTSENRCRRSDELHPYFRLVTSCQVGKK